MPKTDFEWGARSAVQKAIRRGDREMARMAAEVLWDEDPHWLQWRLPAIVPEEVWQLTPVNHAVLKEVESLMRRKQKASAREKIIDWTVELSSYEKNRDPNGLVLLVLDDWAQKWINDLCLDEFRTNQLSMCREFIARKKAGGDASLFTRLERESANLGEWQSKIVDAAKGRYFAGGMDGDRCMLLCLCVMALTEKELPEAKKTDVQGDWEYYNGNGQWPWYVYDMHNARGKRAMNKLLGRDASEETKFFFTRIWFALESGRVNKLDDLSFWWRAYLRCFLKQFGMNRAKWNAPNGFRDRLRSLV